MRLRTPLIDLAELEKFSDEELRELYANLQQLDELQARNPLDFFQPYEPQLEFFQFGQTKRERLFMAGNQTGKSTSGAFETACHLTGNYPEWWNGRRFNKPVVAWACGQSGQQIRETIQLKLLGMPEGPSVTGGLVPKHLFLGRTLSHGAGDLFDQVKIRHASGGISVLSFKSYEQDATKWQGQTIDFAWIDEEPPAAHYNEALARLTGKGFLYITFTPLLGYSEVVSRFLRETDEEKMADRVVVRMGIRHVSHFSEDEKRQRINAYPAHEREARANGDPVLGSGAVFSTPEADIRIDPNLQVPLHWAKIWGLDFGGASATSHAFGAVLMAWDRDTDIVYVLATVRLLASRIIEHAAAIKRIAPDVRCAWPHDGQEAERGTGRTVAQLYRDQGLHMLPSHATWSDGGFSTEAGISEMDARMADGRFRVKGHLSDWFDEYRGYHRKDGKLVKERDDLLSATRIGIMSLRFARPGPIGGGLVGPTARRSIPTIAHGVDFDLFG